MSRVEGADEFIRDLQKLGAEMPQVERAMLKAGGQVMAEDGWKAEITDRDFVDSGAMRDNVTCKVKTGKGRMRAEITAIGQDSRGVRNAAKAFYLHYGTSRGIPPSHWIDSAEADGYPKANAAMRARLDQALNETIGAKR